MRLLRVTARLLLVVLLLIPVLFVTALVLAFDTRPAIDRGPDISPENIARAKRILDANDPRFMRPGAVRTIRVTPDDADVAVNYLMRRYADGSGAVTFEHDNAVVAVSVRPPGLPAWVFLNLRVALRSGAPFPSIAWVRAGRLPVPVTLAESFLTRVLDHAFSPRDRETFSSVVRRVDIGAAGMALTYEWQAALEDSLRNSLMTPENTERLRLYNNRLVEVVAASPDRAVSLATLIRPLFDLAASRSRPGEPVLENRAAILVLTAYANGQSLAAVVPEARSWPRARALGVLLNDRGDSALHFIVSAMLAANTGGPFADAVGLYKEISDSRGGSGFSFNDLGADRAGSRLGELAEGATSARRLQDRLRVMESERAIIPDVSDMPEGLSEAEFTRRFGGVGAPAYNRMLATINDRVARLSAFQ